MENLIVRVGIEPQTYTKYAKDMDMGIMIEANGEPMND